MVLIRCFMVKKKNMFDALLPLEILGHPHLRRKVDLGRNEAPLRLGQRPGVAVPANDGRLKRKSVGNMIF